MGTVYKSEHPYRSRSENSHDDADEENPLATHAVPTLYLHMHYNNIFTFYTANVKSMRIANGHLHNLILSDRGRLFRCFGNFLRVGPYNVCAVV